MNENRMIVDREQNEDWSKTERGLIENWTLIWLSFFTYIPLTVRKLLLFNCMPQKYKHNTNTFLNVKLYSLQTVTHIHISILVTIKLPTFNRSYVENENLQCIIFIIFVLQHVASTSQNNKHTIMTIHATRNIKIQ